MPRSIALCLEAVGASSSRDRFVRCVALPGDRPGLGVGADGKASWLCDAGAFELWVSADEQLILLRPSRVQVRVVVSRAGRSLEVPADKPVVLLDQDEVDLGDRRLRIHVHGTARSVHKPTPLEERVSGNVSKLAVAVAIGASAVGCKTPETRTPDDASPATVSAPEAIVSQDAGTDAEVMDGATEAEAEASDVGGDAGGSEAGLPGVDTSSPDPRKPPIEVRQHPPKPVSPRDKGF